MSSFDFAITVAIGSIIASTILAKDPPLFQAVMALGVLYAVQMAVASLRGNSTVMSKVVDNEPLLLMKGEKVLDQNLKKAKVTNEDLRAKLREANITQINQIKAAMYRYYIIRIRNTPWILFCYKKYGVGMSNQKEIVHCDLELF